MSISPLGLGDWSPVPAAAAELFALLSRRWRRRCAALAVAQFLLVLFLLGAVSYAWDRWAPLTPPALQVLTIVAFGISMLSLLRWFTVRAPAPQSWAGFVEGRHPELAEILSTLVGLPQVAGSPFVSLLARRAEEQLGRLDRRSLLACFPVRGPILAMMVVVLVAGLALALVPGYAAFTQRVYEAWRPAADAHAVALAAVTALEPIELLEAKVHCTPPPYVENLPQHTVELRQDRELSMLQHGRIEGELSFSRAPPAARLVLQPAHVAGPELALALILTGTTARFEHRAEQCGTWRAVLEIGAAQGSVQSLSLGAWTVLADRPPRFTGSPHVEGMTAGAERIAVDDLVTVSATVEDDIGLESLDVEVRVNEDPLRLLPWQRLGGKTHAEVSAAVPLPRGLEDGDVVRLRLRAADNRRLPALDLGPQLTHAPAPTHGDERWIELRVDRRVEPLRARAIATQRDEVQQRLQAVRDRIDAARRRARELARLAAKEPKLSPLAARELSELRQLTDEIGSDLRRAAQGPAAEPALAGMEAELADIARLELAESGHALDSAAQPQRTPAQRGRDLGDVDGALGRALERIDRLLSRTEDVAQTRRDALALERLAHLEAELERRLRALADAAKDRPAAELSKLATEQQQIEAALEALGQQSAALQAGAAERLLEQRLPKLVSRQQELARAAEQAADQAGVGRMEALTAAAAALQQRQLARALDLLRQGETGLSEIADMLGQSPHGAARQLAKQQRDLRDGLVKLAQDFPRLKESELRERLQKLAQQQQKLAALVDKVAPPGAASRQPVRAAADALAKGDPLAGLEAAEKALAALTDMTASPKAATAAENSKLLASAQALLKAETALRGEVEKMAAALPAKSQQAEPAPLKADPAALADLERGLQQMRQARAQLPEAAVQAAASMNRASQLLQSASRQLMQSLRGAPPQASAPSATGQARRPEMSPASAAGRAWGEMPGELRTKLLHDLRGRYGDDYADVIRRYFERLAAGD
jgi:hypothetical protein